MHMDKKEETRFDPKRRLCPDGGCIGIIGPDGRCKECGRPAAGMAAVPAEASRPDHAEGAGAAAPEGDGGDRREAAPSDGTAFDANRRLCDDGSCVGVVGADGACRVCGRRTEA